MNKTSKSFFCAGMILLLVVGAYGCGDFFSVRTIREREPEKTQPIATSYRFEDIPLPPGMNLNRKESFVYETGTTRTGLLVYEGKGEMEKLANFFKQQMPKHQWRLVSNFELHNVMLTFIKEGWSSVIYIQPQGDETRRIEIRVGPIEIKVLPPTK
ncbi:MAG: hypothetical protein FJ110_07905 [Deltaproteobacteria bacterium]|nr:hypothetical protein [Deltaproteobacteria bacterium]